MQKSSTRSKRQTRAQRGMMFLLFALIVTAGIVLHQRITPHAAMTPNLNAHNLNGRNLTLKVTYTPSGPPAELAAGLPTQGQFKLAAVTRSGPTQFAPPPFSVSDETQASATPDSTGIWIEVNGSIGTKALPLIPGRHSWRLGDFALKTYIGTEGSLQDGGVMRALGNPPTKNRLDAAALPTYSVQSIGFGQGKQTRILLYQWMWMARQTQVSPDIPYRLNVLSSQDSSGTQSSPSAILLTPRNLSRRFHLTVQPVSADQKPLGGSVTPRLVSIGEHLLFAEIPSGYSHQTHGFLLHLTDQQQQGAAASWRITDLPQSAQHVSASPSLVTHQTIGKWTVTAIASESPDYGLGDSENDTPPTLPQGKLHPQNIDGHPYIGLPSLRCRIQVVPTPLAPRPPFQTYALMLQAVTPQWSPSESDASSQATTVRNWPMIALYLTPPNSVPTAFPTNTLDLLRGYVYPGQQHFVQIEGKIIQYSYRTEMLTFHDADLVYDDAENQWQFIWNHSQTQTTPSGISIAVLNPRPGKSVLTGQGQMPQDVALCLAWRLPHTISYEQFSDSSNTSYTNTRQFESPFVQMKPPGMITSVIPDFMHTVDWGALGLPDSPMTATQPALPPSQNAGVPVPQTLSPFASLIHHGYSAQVLFMPSRVGSPQHQTQHLSTVTLTLRTRILQKSTPFRLIVPVQRLRQSF